MTARRWSPRLKVTFRMPSSDRSLSSATFIGPGDGALPGAKPVEGRVRWDPVHSLWNGGMMLGALILCPLTASLGAAIVFLLTTSAGLLLGHSVGFHRRLIHRSFECPRAVE